MTKESLSSGTPRSRPQASHSPLSSALPNWPYFHEGSLYHSLLFFPPIIPAKILGLIFIGLVDVGHVPIPEPIIVTGAGSGVGVKYLVGQAWATCPFLELRFLKHFWFINSSPYTEDRERLQRGGPLQMDK